jgi:hypothetical protein
MFPVAVPQHDNPNVYTIYWYDYPTALHLIEEYGYSTGWHYAKSKAAEWEQVERDLKAIMLKQEMRKRENGEG